MKTDTKTTNKPGSLPYLLKWLLLCCTVGLLSGSASALFLALLQQATEFREAHSWMLLLLPLLGLLCGSLYHYAGASVSGGNNLLIEEFHTPRRPIPFRMAPLVLAGTLLTHLGGGSAGREGTAVQMGAALAERLKVPFRLNRKERRILLITGISGGFASVFGTPLAGAVFGLEVLHGGRTRYTALLPALLSALVADLSCRAWQIGHTHYPRPVLPEFSFSSLGFCIAAGMLFGLAALLFSQSIHACTRLFVRYITWPPLRPLLGGTVLAALFWYGGTRYAGLGISVIGEAFRSPAPAHDFLLKILFTAFTLGAGFKGGEVTPLFFTGAVLGSALSPWIPLPLSLLTALGFTAVFAGASNTPLACILMGIELFGAETAIYLVPACITAYFFSGHKGIYSSQAAERPGHLLFGTTKKRLMRYPRR
ncbi:MAG: chloride channel protein [Bacteroidia bacterium]|nr:chloride channel protein [Bacteroidia bacterium]